MDHFLLKPPKSIFHGLSVKQRDDHTCYIIKNPLTVLVLYDISETNNWNRRMEQKAEELYEDHEDGWCTFQTTIFSR